MPLNLTKHDTTSSPVELPAWRFEIYPREDEARARDADIRSFRSAGTIDFQPRRLGRGRDRLIG